MYYIHNRFLDHQDQQYIVSHFSELATTARSLKDPETALKVLEQKREVVLGLLMNDRSNNFELKAIYSELYARYEILRLEVNKPVKKDAKECSCLVTADVFAGFADGFFGAAFPFLGMYTSGPGTVYSPGFLNILMTTPG